MLDRLAGALRRYELIRPQPDARITLNKGKELADWVERDVGCVVDELMERSVFQTQARWPLDCLLAGARSGERQLVESIESRLSATARRLAAFSKQHHPAADTSVPTVAPTHATITLGGDGGSDADEAKCDLELSRVRDWKPLSGGALMEFIAGKPWRDLASIADYFYPAAELNLADRELYLGPGTQQVQIGVCLPFLNPRLRPLGDFISRMLLIRVEYWCNALNGFFSACTRSVGAEVCDRDVQWSAAQEDLTRLTRELVQLRHMLSSGNAAKLRDACLTLVQTHAAFFPESDFSWLGEASNFVVGAAYYRDAIEHRDNFCLAEQIAAALAECAECYRTSETSEEVLSKTLARHSLVLVEGIGRREAYWKRAMVGERWGGQPALWQFLLALAEGVKAQPGVDSIKLNCSLKDARSRIKQLIPPDLDSLILPSGRGTYVLKLQPHEVCVLRWQEEERLTPQL
jgi:hypothetical protein